MRWWIALSPFPRQVSYYLNQPRITQRVEQVLADAFHAQAAALVQGAGTGAIRAGLAALLKPGQRLLVHDAPV